MAEGGEDIPLIPHGEDHDVEEEGEENHGLDFREDHYSPSKDKRKPDVKKRARKLVQSYLRRTGLMAPDDLFYTTWMVERGEIKLISLDNRNWYEILAGVEDSKKVHLVAAGYNDQPAPPQLYRRIGAEIEEVEGGDERTPLARKEEEKEEAGELLKRVFVEPSLKDIFFGKDEFGRTWVSLMRRGASKYIVTEDGLEKFKTDGKLGTPSQKLMNALGKTKVESVEQAQIKFSRNEDRINDLKSRLAEAEKTAKAQRDQIKRLKDANQDLERMIERRNREVNDLKNKLKDSISPSERQKLEKEIKDLTQKLARQKEENAEAIRANQEKINYLEDDLNMDLENLTAADKERIQEEIARLEKENEALEEEIEETFSGLSLKEKVKVIFKKYRVTVVGVLAAVGTVIGVIVSNLRAGLTKVAKGVGNGLKDLGKKLAGILPGMVGAIVSFLFKAAGEAVGFLAKHAWLLILLVVTFVIEQYKK